MALFLKCDMQSEDEIKAMYKWIEEHPDLGKVDVCIPNAGLSSNTTLLEGSINEGHNPNLILNTLIISRIDGRMADNAGRERIVITILHSIGSEINDQE